MNKKSLDTYAALGSLEKYDDETYIIAYGLWELMGAKFYPGGFKGCRGAGDTFVQSGYLCPVCGSGLLSADAKGNVYVHVLAHDEENEAKRFIDPVGEVFLCGKCRTMFKAPYGESVERGLAFVLPYQVGVYETTLGMLEEAFEYDDDAPLPPPDMSQADMLANDIAKLVTDFGDRICEMTGNKYLKFDDVYVGSHSGYPFIEATAAEGNQGLVFFRAIVIMQYDDYSKLHKEIQVPNIGLPQCAKHSGMGKKLIAELYELAKEYGFRLLITDMASGINSFYERLKRRGARVVSNDCLEITDDTDLVNAVKHEKAEAKFKVGETHELIMMLTAAGAQTESVIIAEVMYDEYANRYAYKVKPAGKKAHAFLSTSAWYPEESFADAWG